MQNVPLLRILNLRNESVVLDSDLAKIYGVPTHRFNEAIKRNATRFPKDFAFVVRREELAQLISQNAISKPARGGRTKLPRVFTEHGALQAANVLKSKRAVEMSLYVIRAFIRQRAELATSAAILRRLAEIDKTLVVHDAALRELFETLRPLLSPPPSPSKPKIGFHP